jgi:hypothetical protein
MHVVDDKTAPDKVQQQRRTGRPFTVAVGGSNGAGVVGRVLVEALREGLDLDRLAVMSWSTGTALRNTTRATIAKAQGYPPDLSLEDMIPGADPDLIGSVWEILWAHSYDNRQPVTGEHRRAVIAEYLDLIRRAAQLGDDPLEQVFMRGVHRQIDAAIRLSISSRLNEVSLHDAHRAGLVAGKRWPAFSFVAEVADYFRDYKRDLGVADLADHLAARLEPVTACNLALIEDAGAVPLLGLRALRRLLPNASFVLAGVDSDDAKKHVSKIFSH